MSERIDQLQQMTSGLVDLVRAQSDRITTLEAALRESAQEPFAHTTEQPAPEIAFATSSTQQSDFADIGEPVEIVEDRPSVPNLQRFNSGGSNGVVSAGVFYLDTVGQVQSFETGLPSPRKPAFTKTQSFDFTFDLSPRTSD